MDELAHRFGYRIYIGGFYKDGAAHNYEGEYDSFAISCYIPFDKHAGVESYIFKYIGLIKMFNNGFK